MTSPSLGVIDSYVQNESSHMKELASGVETILERTVSAERKELLVKFEFWATELVETQNQGHLYQFPFRDER